MAIYTIEFAPAAIRQFEKLPRNIQLRIKRKIDGLAQNPRPPGIKKLAGLEDLYRIRIGDYRVIYQIQDKVLRVLVLKIGDRKEVYH